MKKVLKLILVNVVVFIILMIIADAVVGYFSKTTPSKVGVRTIRLAENPPGLDEEFMASKEYLANTQNLRTRKTRIRTDSNGYIIGPKITNKAVDIIFFGGSTTECKFLDEAVRFPYLVSQQLVNQSGQQICTLNAGVSGNNSLHSTLSFMAKGLVYHPRIVVFMENINDLTQLINCRSYWIAPATRAIVQEQKSRKQLFRNIISSLNNLLIPNISKKIVTIINSRSNRGNVDEWSGFRKQDTLTTEDFNNLQSQFRSSVTSFITTANNWGIQPILMTQFNRINNEDSIVKKNYKTLQLNVSYDDYVKYYSMFNETIRQIAEDEHCLLIDLDKEIPHTSAYIYDAVHLNEAGSQLVAQIISKTISQNIQAYRYSPP